MLPTKTRHIWTDTNIYSDAGGQGGPTRNFGVQLTLFQPGVQIMPTKIWKPNSISDIHNKQQMIL